MEFNHRRRRSSVRQRSPTDEDEWIDAVERFDEYLFQFTQQNRQATAFDLPDESIIDPKSSGWELCETVIARRNVIEKRSEGW